jgi:hypothetical protein
MSILLDLDLSRFIAPALCAEIGGDEWHPEKGGYTGYAKTICGRCEARIECLTYALAHGLDNSFDGIWGGTTPRERRVMRRAAEAAATEMIIHPAGPPTLAIVPDPAPAARPMRGWHPAELTAAVHQLRQLGMHTAEIAAALDVSAARVRAA